MNRELSVYQDLTTEFVNGLPPEAAEQLTIELLAEGSRIRGQGKILSWSEFNENPDPLVNRLLARILVSKIDKSLFNGVAAEQIAVLSIENSAGYLASEICHELAQKFHLARIPRIIRARKSPDKNPPSPAMGEIQASATVFPITSGGKPRYLVASVPSETDLQFVQNLIPVDDFLATGETLRGGIKLGLSLLSKSNVTQDNLNIIPVAGLGKPEQETVKLEGLMEDRHLKILTAIDVRFWPDPESGKVYIQANGFKPIPMKNASLADFSQ